MMKRETWLALFLFMSCFSVFAYGANSSLQIPLSTAEREWLKNHPVIKVGIDADYAPYSFTGVDGHYMGVVPDFLAIISEKLGIRFSVIPGLTWSEILNRARNKQLDLIATVVQTPERDMYLTFTDIYIPTPLVIMTRSNDKRITTPADLAGKRVALVEEYSTSKRVMQEHPGVIAYPVDTPLDGLVAVAKGAADAYVGVIGVNTYLASKHGISNLQVSAGYEMHTNGQRIGVRKDWPLLASILQKSLHSIPEKQRLTILHQWLPTQSSAQTRINSEQAIRSALSKKEKAWLKAHPEIRLGVDPSWPPIEFFNNEQQYDGMSADYVRIIGDGLGITMRPIPNLSWSEVLQKIQAMEVDVLPAVMKSPAREKYMNFTKPYIEFPMVIITRPETSFQRGIDDLTGKRVAVVRNYVTHDIIETNHPQINLYPTKNVESGLLLLSTGEVDAYIGNLAAISYTVNQLGITNLKVAGTTHYSYPLSMGVRKDWPELIGILNKAIIKITQHDTNTIRTRWTAVRVEHGVDTEKIVFWSAIVSFVIIVIFSLVFLWNRRLSVEIKRRLEAEKELITTRDAAVENRHELAKAKTFLQMVLDNSPASIIIADAPKGKISYINHAAWAFIGRAEEKTHNISMQEYVSSWRAYYPDGTIYQARNLPLARALHHGEIVKGEEILVKMNDGSHKWASASSAPIYDEANTKVVSAIIVFIDISNQKRIEEALSQANLETVAANARLKELDRLKSMFIASISHELRTPLNSIIGFSSMMVNESFGELNSKYMDYVNRINNSGTHLLSLIKDIIDISKIESGRIETYITDFPLEEVFNEAVTSNKPEIEKKNLIVETHLSASIIIRTDRLRLLQCLLNLLSNAVKYSEQGKIVISATNEHDSVTISVQDTGIGISEEDLPRLFEAFERIDTHLKVRAGGTGLGLYLTKKIVSDVLKGSVGVESIPGKGSCFWIKIPTSIPFAKTSAHTKLLAESV